MAKKKTKKAAKKTAAKKAKPAKKKTTVKAKSKPKAKAKKAAPKKSAPKKAAKKPAKKTAVKKSAAPKAKPMSAPKTAPTAKVQNAGGDHPLLGSEFPRMTLTNQNGEEVDVAEVIQDNPKVVLYFYPKDDTPGCTKEACDFRDNMNRVEQSGVKIYGISPDDAESHRKFISKYGLNFDLLTDANHALADALSLWKEKSFMGKSYMGVERSTFLINNGLVAKVWQPVKVEGHVDEILSAATEL